MEKIILVLIGIYIFKIIYEKISLDKNRKKIKTIIHVNGIRGKSTMSRLIDAGLREEGKKVYTKVTGTAPRIIGIDNIEIPINRRGKANIREQIKILNKVKNLNLDYLVLECMAVRPEYQEISEEKILKANIGVITNVREDHLDEMGGSLDSIADSLSKMIPSNGVLFTSEEKYFKFFKEKAKEKNSKVYLSKNNKKEYEEVDFPENVALALEVCKYLGIKEEEALSKMKNYKRDSGVLREIKFLNKNQKEIIFVNALAANDPDSSNKILDLLREKNLWKKERYLMVNNRQDRVSRMEQFIKFTKENQDDFYKILISGESKEIFYKKLKEEGLEEKLQIINTIEDFENIEEDALVFAVGNICGVGKRIVDAIEERQGMRNE